MTDYHNFTNKETSKKERNSFDVGDIWINAVRCKNCNEIIRSKNRHDFVTCQCGNISVDGGSWYLKRVGNGEYEELSEEFTYKD